MLQLLRQGYRIKTTLRSLSSRNSVLETLKTGGIISFDKRAFIEADLTKDANWDEAVQACRYVIHVASPVFFTAPKDENEQPKPAVEGTLRV